MEIMHSGYLLTLLAVLPALGALILIFVKGDEEARNVSILVALGVFALSVVMLKRFDPAGGMQFLESRSWMPELGLTYSLGVDGLSVWLIMLTTFLTTLVLIASRSVHKKVRAYLAMILLLETGMLGTFMALDGVAFYIFWELMLIPMYFLIGVWGGARRIYAALKFVIYTAFGSLLMLVAIAYLGWQASVQLGHWSFLLSDWMRLTFTPGEELLLFSAFALAFAIKIPLFPFHTWLPDAHVEAPTGGSVILAGVLLKMGIYGLIRFAFPVFPYAAVQAMPILATLGVVGIVYGALVAWVQTDMKKLVAYSSVSHLGFCVLGLAAMNIQGVQGCMIQLLNHGVSTGALFFLVGVLYDRKHSREISDYGGLASKLPIFSVVFLVFTLSSIALPLTNGFVGEFLILLGGYQYNKILAAVAVTGVVLGAMYMLSLYRRVVFGPFDEKKNGDLTDLNWTEGVVFAPLLALVFYLGLHPGPILRAMEPVSSRSIAVIENRGKSGVATNELERAINQASWMRPAKDFSERG